MDNREQGLAGLRTVSRHATLGRQDSAAARSRGPQQWLQRQLLRRLMEACGNPPVQLVLWNGESWAPPGARPVARMHIRDPGTLWRLMLDPEFQFGEAWSQGRVEIEGDLVRFLVAVYRALSSAARDRRRTLSGWIHRPRSTNPHRARDNIHAHYDLGNDFYRRWLDREMVYTCAYFPRPDATLEEAQIAKMHHVCRKLRLRAGEAVVEAGCGWGSLALFMARHYGVKVRAYNISREQIAYARARARAEGLAGMVEFIEDDYRNVKGTCDAFVSVGMLEHVGQKYYPALGAVIDNVLREQGRGLIHTIGRVRPGAMNAWIERRIFPGACPPSLGEMMAIFEPRSLAVTDVENLRLHYARTLEHWLARFESASPGIRAAFDEDFVRAWRLYLAGSVAAFLTGDLHLYQVVFNRSSNNELPWTRAHLYTGRQSAGETAVFAGLRHLPAANSSD